MGMNTHKHSTCYTSNSGFLSKLRITEDSDCSLCEGYSEKSIYIIWNCAALYNSRTLEHMQRDQMQLKKIYLGKTVSTSGPFKKE